MKNMFDKPSVLVSIKPKYCELIASGKKTIEVRKTRPKIETPFKSYIYCTKGKLALLRDNEDKSECYKFEHWNRAKFHEKCGRTLLNGKVIGEFVCDKIDEIHIPTELVYEKEVAGFSERTLNILNQSCLSYDEIIKYSGFTFDNYNAQKEYLYGWHISDLVIYDKPKELSEFNKIGALNYDEWLYGIYNGRDENSYEKYLLPFKITRPPQSWCYVSY